MTKIIGAVLHYTVDQKSFIIEHEKLRRSVIYLNKFYIHSFSSSSSSSCCC